MTPEQKPAAETAVGDAEANECIHALQILDAPGLGEHGIGWCGKAAALIIRLRAQCASIAAKAKSAKERMWENRHALEVAEAERDMACWECQGWAARAATAEAARDLMAAALRDIAGSGPVNEHGETDAYAAWSWCYDRANAALASPPAAAASQGRDTNVEAVRAKLLERSAVGLKKYGKPTSERTELNSADWLRHLQEELMDAAVYVQALLAPRTAQGSDGEGES